MRTEKINGVSVPYKKTTDELEIMLLSGDMTDYVVACEALSYKTDEKAFVLLKGYMYDKDKYKRLYVLKTIFRHPYAIQLKDFLIESILSDDLLFVENGLKIACDYEFEISDEIIFTAVYKHFKNLYCSLLYVLKKITKNETNFLKMVELFNLSEFSGQKEVLNDILCEKYLPEKAEVLFSLFSNDSFSKIRLSGLKIGMEYGFDISEFYDDSDGHIKKIAATQKEIGRVASTQPQAN